MASSPQFFAPSAQNPEPIDIDSSIRVALPDDSCPGVAPSAVAYSNSDQTSYSEVSHISPFDTSSLLDDSLLTPASSASSPLLQQRSCEQSPFLQQRELSPCLQVPTPPNSTAMYSYSDYTTSSMPMQTTAAEAPHELLAYLHGSPGHVEQPPPPPPNQPYFGSYSVSEPQEPGPEHYYLQNGAIDNALGLMRADVVNGDSYTHRPVATMTQAPQMPTMLPPSHPPYRRELGIPLPRLPPSQSRNGSMSTRRDPNRKPKARRNQRRGSFGSPAQGQVRVGEQVLTAEDDGPDEEVTLDDKTPADLRRLWDTRRKWLGKKGNGMWEDIMTEFLGEDSLSENKKTQVKASLQMKIHRMLLKHGKWPGRDEAALLRAYKRWEENRYNEILRLYEEEMGGRRKAYEWKSQHIEAQLVKMGLEEPERDRESKARKRKQVAARHQARAGTAAGGPRGPLAGAPSPPHHQHHARLPGMFEPAAYHYGQHPLPHGHGAAAHHYDPRFEAAGLAEQLGVSHPPPPLTDEQHERMIDEVLERNAFEDEDDEDDEDEQQQQPHPAAPADVRMSEHAYDAVRSRPRAGSLLPGIHGPPADHNGHGMPSGVGPGVNARRSAAVARGACAEMLSRQQYGPGVGA